MQGLIDAGIQLLLFFFSFLTPKKKNLILFGSGPADEFHGNPKYLFLYLVNNQTAWEYYWVTGSKARYKTLRDRDLSVLYKYSFKAFRKILRSRFLVVEKSSRDVYYINSIVGRFRFLQTWHGTPLKKIGFDAISEKKGMFSSALISNEKVMGLLSAMKVSSRQRFRLILSASDEVSKHLASSFHQDKNIVVLGYPRNDLFFKPELLFTEVGQKLHLEDYKTVLLYAPTFRDNYQEVSPFSPEGLGNINAFLHQDESLLIIKKHPLEQNISIPSGLSNIIDVSDQNLDIQELLYYTSVLITDYSSAFFDFILTDRPVIFYSYDYEDYIEKCRGMYYDYYKELPGPFATNEAALLDLIRNSSRWFTDPEYREKYHQFKARFNAFTDGNSGRRFFDYLAEKW